MRVFIALCVVITGLVSVSCDQAADEKAWLAKIGAMYANMSEADIKMHATDNVKAIEDIMNAAVKRYAKEDLHLVATIDLDIIKFFNQGLPKIFAELDKEEAKLRHINYIEFGTTTEVLKAKAQAEDKKRAGVELKVVDTEANLLTKYKDIYNKILALLKWTVTEEKKVPAKAFWANLHQAIYDFMAPGLDEIEAAVEHLPQASRAKNLQLLVNDLTYLLEVADSRPKGGFVAEVKEKVIEIAAKVKAFFAKIF